MAVAAGEVDEPRPALAFLAGQGVVFDEADLNGARRRAVLLLATGGDPRGGLALEGRAVTALAGDLADERRSADLALGVQSLRRAAEGLEHVARALDELLADRDLAWRALACALLADELGGEAA